MELLAPAKNLEGAILAINCGADALYCSGPGFSARVNAAISYEDLKEIIDYAHIYEKKVYVTVNTLIDNPAVDAIVRYIIELNKLNVDALIVQDLGLLNIVRQLFPKMELHASTQMHVDNISGMKYIKKQGLIRGVVPREMNLEEIKAIKDNVDIQLEAFIHGALCVSYSGQCLYSYFDNKGSGNKGACKQNCRQLHSINGKETYALSLKDLGVKDNIKKFEGYVDSLKIEGRLKNLDYIYSNVTYYHDLLNGSVNKEMYDLSQIAFNRKHTKGNILGANSVSNPSRVNNHGLFVGKVTKIDKEYIQLHVDKTINRLDSLRFVYENEEVGITLDNLYDKDFNKVDIIRQGTCYIKTKVKLRTNSIIYVVKTRAYDKIIKATSEKYYLKKDLYGSLYIVENQPMTFITYTGNTYTSDFIVEKANNKPTSAEEIIKQMQKTNYSPFNVTYLDNQISDNVFIPKSKINEFKREIIEQEMQLLIKRDTNEMQSYDEVLNIKKKFKNFKHVIRTYEQAQVLAENNIKEVYVDNIELLSDIEEMFDNIIPILPRVVKEDNFNYYLEKTKKYNRVMVSELGMYNALVKEKEIELNYSFNLTNNYALDLLNKENVKNAIISYEVKEENLFSNEDIETSVIVYSKKPYMIIGYKLDGLSQQVKELGHVEMTNNNDQLLHALDYEQDLIEILSEEPLQIVNKQLNADYQFVVFTIEDAQEVQEVLRKFK